LHYLILTGIAPLSHRVYPHQSRSFFGLSNRSGKLAVHPRRAVLLWRIKSHFMRSKKERRI